MEKGNTLCSRRQQQGIWQRQGTKICDTDGAPNSWQNFPTESAICGRDDGFSDRLDNITFPKWRNESIKAYGNAVVPQLILPIFQTIEKLHLNL
jgi:DNA (cytosine-5)-methyltransferase 1